MCNRLKKYQSLIPRGLLRPLLYNQRNNSPGMSKSRVTIGPRLVCMTLSATPFDADGNDVPMVLVTVKSIVVVALDAL